MHLSVPVTLEVGVLEEDRGCGCCPRGDMSAGELRGMMTLLSRRGEIFCFKGLFCVVFLTWFLQQSTEDER